MLSNLDWMHGLAAALGALAAAFVPKLAPRSGASPSGTSSGGAAAQHPLFDALIQVLEGKLTELIHVEPGPDGEPMFTLRVVLVQGETKK